MFYNGVGFLWSNISIYVLSYLYLFDHSVRADSIFAVDLGINIMNCVGNLFGTYLLNDRKINPKIVIMIAATISLSSIFASSFVTSLEWFIILYGLWAPFGLGMCYFLPVVCAWDYFPDHKGRVTGILMSAYGLSSFFLNIISSAIVNPNDE